MFSLSRVHYAMVLLSAIVFISRVGDLAKLGKLGKYVKYVDSAVDLALKNSHFKTAVAPVLIKLEEAANAVKHSAVWNTLSDKSQDALNDILNKIDTLKLDGSMLASRVIPNVGMHFNSNLLTWGFDDLGRTTSLKGDIREIFSNRRSSSESSMTSTVGNSPDASANSVGGHVGAHIFTGEDTGLFNAVPQNGRRDPISAADVSNLNQGAYKQFENEVSDWVSRGGRVEFDVELAYSGVSKEPDSYSILYSVFDKEGNLVFEPRSQELLNQAGQVFRRTSGLEMERILKPN